VCLFSELYRIERMKGMDGFILVVKHCVSRSSESKGGGAAIWIFGEVTRKGDGVDKGLTEYLWDGE